MKYTIYNPDTGEILRRLHSDNQELLDLNLVGHAYVEGDYDTKQYYIKDGIAVERQQDPSTYTQKYYYHWITHTWLLDTLKTEVGVRSYRTELLTPIDNVSPVRWNSLTPEQQAELQTYRQDLLDITNQEGFPTSVEWPIKPVWL